MRIAGRFISIYLFAIIFLIWTIVPIYWLLSLSLMSQSERMVNPTPLYPRNPTFLNYARILGISMKDGDGVVQVPSGNSKAALRGLRNSAVVATVVTIITMVVALPSAYSLGRLKFRFRNSLLFGIIACRSLPDMAMLIPFFILFQVLGMQGTLAGIVILHFASITPIIVWVLMTIFEVLPKSVEREARIDGCNRSQAFWRVIVPMALPGIISALSFTWMISWNEFTYGLFIGGGSEAGTYPPILSALLAVDYGLADYQAASAAMVIGLLPSVVLAFVYQRQMRSLNVVSPF